MKAILIPVKEFREAKKRLAPHFPPGDRAALAEAMCEDFFNVVAATRCADRVFVISKEPGALSRARKLGWETIVESSQTSESDSVDEASRYCAEHSIDALLRLPIDLPLAEPSDIEAVFQELEAAPSAVIVPSSDGTGTNALLRSPAVLFPSRFGPNSFPRHLAEAKACGARARVYRNRRLELDIDELDDLRRLSSRLRPDSATARWLLERDLSGIAKT
ncbi:MAG: 2-phospho-L-lactate guanylyltransferase [Candidatus Acidiferrales bacterium]